MAADGRHLGVTPREAEVLGWVARGKTNVEIAAALFISPQTVRKHLENIFEKLGVRTRTAAAAYARAMLGERNVKIYEGSWTDWGNLADVPNRVGGIEAAETK